MIAVGFEDEMQWKSLINWEYNVGYKDSFRNRNKCESSVNSIKHTFKCVKASLSEGWRPRRFMHHNVQNVFYIEKLQILINGISKTILDLSLHEHMLKLSHIKLVNKMQNYKTVACYNLRTF